MINKLINWYQIHKIYFIYLDNNLYPNKILFVELGQKTQYVSLLNSSLSPIFICPASTYAKYNGRLNTSVQVAGLQSSIHGDIRLAVGIILTLFCNYLIAFANWSCEYFYATSAVILIVWSLAQLNIYEYYLNISWKCPSKFNLDLPPLNAYRRSSISVSNLK